MHLSRSIEHHRVDVFLVFGEADVDLNQVDRECGCFERMFGVAAYYSLVAGERHPEDHQPCRVVEQLWAKSDESLCHLLSKAHIVLANGWDDPALKNDILRKSLADKLSGPSYNTCWPFILRSQKCLGQQFVAFQDRDLGLLQLSLLCEG